MPSGFVTPAAGGGSQTVRLLGPYAITYQTPNINNPSDNGALVGSALAVGTLILATWIDTTTPWVAATSIDEVSLNTTTNGLMDLNAGQSALLASGATYQVYGGAGQPPVPVWIQDTGQRIAVAFYTTGALTAGAGNVYALSASIA